MNPSSGRKGSSGGGGTFVVDHLVWGVADLDAGVEEMARRTGVRPAAGGRHPGWGTANALLSLGPRTYLEVIGPDPEAGRPAEEAVEKPLPFGLAAVAPGAGRLLGWAAAVEGLEERVEESRRNGYDPGDAVAMSRRRPDGSLLSWHLALPPDASLREGGIVPFLIDWQESPHPAEETPAAGRLLELSGEHPWPAEAAGLLTALGVELSLTPGPRPRLVARLETPAGLLVLEG